MANDFTVTFKTKDGSLVVNRRSDAELYFDHRDQPQLQFIQNVLEANSREKGVRVLSYKITKDGLTAIVEWLK